MSPVTTHVEHRFVKVILISVSLLAMMHSRYQVQGAVEPMSVSFSWLSSDTQAVLKFAAVFPFYSLSIL